MGFGILDAFLDLGIDDMVLLRSTELLSVVCGLFLELHMCGVELWFLIDVNCRHVSRHRDKYCNLPPNRYGKESFQESGGPWKMIR
jgi:hypothetical protein